MKTTTISLFLMILWVNWAQLGGSSAPCDTSLGCSSMRVQLAEMSLMLIHIPSTFVGQWKGWVELGQWLLGLSHSMQSLGLSLFTWSPHVVCSLSLSRRVTGFLRGGSGLSEVQKPSWNAQNHIIHLLLSKLLTEQLKFNIVEPHDYRRPSSSLETSLTGLLQKSRWERQMLRPR